MEGLGYACAVLLAAVFVRAGAAKVARPAATAASFRALGVPVPAALTRAVPVLELLVAVALLAAPSLGAVAAIVLLAPFTAVLARAVAGGSEAPCNCFGAARADPVSWVDVVRNLLLAGLAGAAVTVSQPVVPGPRAAVVALAAFGAGWLVLARYRRAASG